MVQVIYSAEDRRKMVAACRRLAEALPSRGALKALAVEHLRNRGRVRFPMQALAARPDGWLPQLKRIARSGSARDSTRSLFDVWGIEFRVPVRIATPWGPTIVDVSLRRGWDAEFSEGRWRADHWICRSRSVTHDLLKIRATAERYHYLLVVLPDRKAARRALAAVRREGRPLRTDLWTLDGIHLALRASYREIALGTGRHFSAITSVVSGEYGAFEQDWNRRREIASELEVPLTPAQRLAGERLADILERPRPSIQEFVRRLPRE
jgi:hypothetical protein